MFISGLALQALCRMTSGVECEVPGTPAQKSNAAPVSDAHEEIQIQGESLSTGENHGNSGQYSLRSSITSGVRSDNLA